MEHHLASLRGARLDVRRGSGIAVRGSCHRRYNDGGNSCRLSTDVAGQGEIRDASGIVF
jgi:hypothetical protein